jgi:hypothetical protein
MDDTKVFLEGFVKKVARWLPVTKEDSRYNVDTRPEYWYERISAVNEKYLLSEPAR